MEQQAKERLTGGVILVALLVLLVPELLTGPRPPPQVAPAQPDQAPIRSYTLDLGESVRADSAPVTASTAEPPASEPAARAPVPSAPAVAAPPPRPETVAPPPPAATGAPRPAAASAPAPLHAAERLPEHPPEHGVEHNTGGWTVQLGTFSSRENAAHLIAGLKSHGFNASVAESTKSGHKLYRVRVGAEHDRAAAQKLLGRLRAAGQKGGEIVPR